jgi:uncharacterized membrane protein
MMLEILRTILGLLFVIFLPGYILSRILFNQLHPTERICLAAGLSIFIVVLLGFFLTFISNMTQIKAISLPGVWISLAAVYIIFAIIFLFRNSRETPEQSLEIRRRGK